VIAPLAVRNENADAVSYVCTLPEEGLAQLEILKDLGCKPHHRVLEIGCGALVAGFPIMQYLDAGNYFGIDPNSWLIQSTLRASEAAPTIVAKRPQFSPRADFRTGLGWKFDFIISHSILSHASDSQLDEFFVAAREQLAPEGVLAASIRLAEGNEFGSLGSARHGADFREWQYPGVSWFKRDDVLDRARKVGLTAAVAPEMTKTILQGNPKAVHDWIVARPTKVTLVTGFFRLEDRRIDEDEQFRQFERLAECGAPILVFLDERLMDRAWWRENVQIVPMRLGDLWPFKWAEGRELTLPAHRTLEKDTRDFLLLQNSKIELLDLARSLDNVSTHFAWIDFGIMKIVRDEESFRKRLRALHPPAGCVLAPGCWGAAAEAPPLTDDVVHWRFCGGFLLVDRNRIRDLVALNATLHADPVSLTWEVNNWARMECAGFHFDWYKADHDDSIIDFEKAIERPKRLPEIPRVCLVMNVRNESKIIERCLTSALPFIDAWAISIDSRSDDNTAELITKFFEQYPLPGKLERIEFKNFAHGRNEGLRVARSVPDWDYALLIDADMVLQGTLDKSALVAPAYKIIQYAGTLKNPNTRLLRRDVPACYVGVTHEHLSVEGVEYAPITSLTIDDRNDGGSKSDKTERDIRLLLDGLQEEPNNERYMFYLGNSYRESDRPHRAIYWYKKRIERGGWDEEIWYSYYGIAICLKDLGDEPAFIEACFEAYNYRPWRAEALNLLATYYREKGKNDPAALIAEAFIRTKPADEMLFMELNVYDFGAKRELAITGYHSKIPERREAGYRACTELTLHRDDFIRNEARRNFTFYAKSAATLFEAEIREIDWKPGDGWAPMNPSIFVEKEARLALVRTVNYVVVDGEYPTIDGSGIIRTRNYIVEMDESWRPIRSTLIEDVTGTPRSKFPVEGLEDCRLWSSADSYFVSATVRDLSDNVDGRCEMIIGRLDEKRRVDAIMPIRDYEGHKTQKNWMPIAGRPGSFLYWCDPTIAIRCYSPVGGSSDVGERTVEIARHTAPARLVDFRGGSQLIRHGDGWLCLVHEVAWRPERVYLHRFVALTEDFRITAVSDLFYFSRVGIEFCAGLARDGKKLVASFGVNDASAHLAFFDPSIVDSRLVPL